MRLTCPDCGAEYEIDDALIPPAGREVECAACGHHWHQAGNSGDPFLLGDPDLSPEVAPEAPPAPAAPRRPRHDASVLDILREEAARELSQRGETLPEASPRQWDHTGDGLGADGALDIAPPPAEDTADESTAPAGRRYLEHGDNEASLADDAAGYDPAGGARAAALGSVPAPEIIVAELIDDDDLPPPRPSLPLPDPALWAASLQWSPAPIAAAPPMAPRGGRSAQDAGFALAAGLSVLLVAGYIAAPHLESAGRPGAAIMEIRHGIDRARLALYDRAAPAVDNALAQIARWLR